MNELTVIEGNELPAKENGGLAAMDLVALEGAIAAVEKRCELMERFHAVIQKKIKPDRDIDKIGDKYRRNMNFARICYGVVGGDFIYFKKEDGSPKIDKELCRDGSGEYYIYKVFGYWIMPGGRKTEGVGLVTSRDSFFGKANGDFKDIAQVDEGNIMAAAITECFKNCIFTGLGFPKDLTEDDLKTFGIDATKVQTGHQFKKRDDQPQGRPSAAQGAAPQSQSASTQGSQESVISEAQAKRLYAIAKGRGMTDGQLKEMINSLAGVDSTKKIPRDKYEVLCKHAEEFKVKSGNSDDVDEYGLKSGTPSQSELNNVM